MAGSQKLSLPAPGDLTCYMLQGPVYRGFLRVLGATEGATEAQQSATKCNRGTTRLGQATGPESKVQSPKSLDGERRKASRNRESLQVESCWLLVPSRTGQMRDEEFEVNFGGLRWT